MTGSIDVRRSFPATATIGSFTTADGWPLRTFERASAQARGSILWLGGRGDIFEKYLECFDSWNRDGWTVSSFDWRGQGGSGRILDTPSIGHIGDFAIWIADLADFWADWVARTPGPHVLMGHSMGGHLVLRALISQAVRPDAVVLSAPMLGFAGSVPAWLSAIAAKILGSAFRHRRAWKDNERPAKASESRQGFLTTDNDRYADEQWWKQESPSLALGPPSWGWMAAAVRSFGVIDAPGAVEGVTVPLLVIGTDGDQLVSPIAIRRVTARLPNAELLMFGQSVAHEVLREADCVRDVALKRIATFLDSHAPRR